MKKKFSITQKPLVFENGFSMQLVEILCDTPSDIPQPQSEWAVGSIAYALNTRAFYVLNSSGKWINQDDFSELPS